MGWRDDYLAANRVQAAELVRPAGEWVTMRDLQADCTRLGSYWFTPGTMARFGSRLLDRVWGGTFFVVGDRAAHEGGATEWGVGWALADGDVGYVPAPHASLRSVWRTERRMDAERLAGWMARIDVHQIRSHQAVVCEWCATDADRPRRSPAYYLLDASPLCSQHVGDHADMLVHGLDHGLRVRGL